MYSPEDYLPEEDFYYQRKSYASSQHAAAASRLASARETNEHLQRLHRRVTDLEEIIRSQGLAINEKEAGHRLLRSQLRELKDIKERQVKELSTTISRLHERNRCLDDEMRRKSEGLDECQKRLIMLDKLLATSLPAVETLVASLKRLSCSSSDLIKMQSKQNANDVTERETDSPLDRDISARNGVSLTNAQFAAENTDSGHPSSASDSYNNVIEEASSPLRKAAAEVEARMGSNGTSGHEASPASPRKQRAYPKVHRNNNRKSNPLLSDSILSELTFSSKGSTPINSNFSPNHSPSYTPPTTRREIKQQLQPHISRPVYSYPGSKYRIGCQDICARSGISSEAPADHPASEIGTILNFSDGEGSDASDDFDYNDDDDEDGGGVEAVRRAEEESSVPPPAPPTSANSANTHLPSLQVPRRFLPRLY